MKSKSYYNILVILIVNVVIIFSIMHFLNASSKSKIEKLKLDNAYLTANQVINVTNITTTTETALIRQHLQKSIKQGRGNIVMLMAVLRENDMINVYHIKHRANDRFYPEEVCACKDSATCKGYNDVLNEERRYFRFAGIHASSFFIEYGKDYNR